MQVDPIKPALKAPETKRLKLKCEEPLLNFAFNFNLRRYIEVLSVLMAWKVGRHCLLILYRYTLTHAGTVCSYCTTTR